MLYNKACDFESLCVIMKYVLMSCHYTQVSATTRKWPIGESEAFFLHSALIPRGTSDYAGVVRLTAP